MSSEAMVAALEAVKTATPDAKSVDERLDVLEKAMLASDAPPVELPVTHRFTPGLYAREIFMPAGTLLTSRIHKTEHPYVVISGKAAVYIEGSGVEHVEAPHVGVTKPGTRRLLYILEDCRWITFHPLVGDEGEQGEDDLDKIEARIIERRELEDGKTAFEFYSAALKELGAPPLLLSGDGEDHAGGD